MRVPTITLPFGRDAATCCLCFSCWGFQRKISSIGTFKGYRRPSQDILRYTKTPTLPLADIVLLPRQIAQASFISLARGARNVTCMTIAVLG